MDLGVAAGQGRRSVLRFSVRGGEGLHEGDLRTIRDPDPDPRGAQYAGLGQMHQVQRRVAGSGVQP